VNAASPFGVFSFVVGVVNYELSGGLLRHVESIHIRLSPRLKVVVDFFVVTVTNASHGFPSIWCKRHMKFTKHNAQ
jgi:hypothetical protein